MGETKKGSHELAKAPAQAVARPAAPQVEGMEDLEGEPLQAPWLIIVQALTKNVGGAPMGSFFLKSIGRDYGPRVRFIPIAGFRSRVYFARDEAQPLCTSLDGKVPLGGEAPIDPRNQIAHDCEHCYFAIRQRDPKNPRAMLPAPCAAQINFFGAVLGEKETEKEVQICMLRLKRTSYGLGSAISSNAKTHAHQVPNLWGHVYELTNKVEESKIGKYAVPTQRVVGLTEKIYPGMADELAGYFASWQSVRDAKKRESVQRDDEEYVEAAPAAGTGAPPADDIPF